MTTKDKRDFCILHIGMPKTGSNAQQEVFFRVLRDDFYRIQKPMECRFDEEFESTDGVGIFSESDLLRLATKSIPDFVDLIGAIPIPFELEEHPQTLAKLVDLLASKLYPEFLLEKGRVR